MPATLSAAESLGLVFWHSAVSSRRCVCSARSMPYNSGISFEHRHDCPADSHTVARIIWPRSQGLR